MTDMLGRELHINDLILQYKSSWAQSKYTPFGPGVFSVVVGADKAYMRGLGVVSIGTAYLIANPDQKELEIKKSLIDSYRQMMMEKLQKEDKEQERKRMTSKKNLFCIGDVLSAEREDTRYLGSYYIYLGERAISGNNNYVDRKKGHVYLNMFASISYFRQTESVLDKYNNFFDRAMVSSKEKQKSCNLGNPLLIYRNDSIHNIAYNWRSKG